jgi:glucoamylase
MSVTSSVSKQISAGSRAAGGPGSQPVWSSSNKSAVGTAASSCSRLWFTLSGSVVTEIFYPSLDSPQVRDLQFVVTDGSSFVTEEHEMEWTLEASPEGFPAYTVVCSDERHGFRLRKEILTDSQLAVLLIHVQLESRRDDLIVYAICNPHLKNQGRENSASSVDTANARLLVAQRDGVALALGAQPSFQERSCGYVGAERGGLSALRSHKHFAETFDSAKNGNVLLCARLALDESRQVLLAVALGQGSEDAVNLLLQSLTHSLAWHRKRFLEDWTKQQQPERLYEQSQDEGALYRASTNLCLMMCDKTFPGGMPASPSIPWGASKGDADRGGYHLCWSRDLAKSGVGMLAAGLRDMPLRSLVYLSSVQNQHGGFPQNFWMNGKPFAGGHQLDEVAFPILLAGRLAREQALEGFDPFPMVLRAAGYIMRQGPATEEERWEEVGGYSPSTLAVCIAAMIEAAQMARSRGEESIALLLEQHADFIEHELERLTVTRQGGLVKGISRHFVRINPIQVSDPRADDDLDRLEVGIANQLPGGKVQKFPASQVVDAGFLELVRYGVRKADDRLIEDSVRVVDAVLRVDTPQGACWRRYNHDGYGQGPAGEPFDKGGVGRAWPLLTGERAHYELAVGRSPEGLIRAMEGFAGPERLLPEQVWDSAELPERGLYLGGPTGSARPLLWAHSEYIKLLRSRRDGAVYELVPEVFERYCRGKKRAAPPQVWTFQRQPQQSQAGRSLRIVNDEKFRLRWSSDEWETSHDLSSLETMLDLSYVDVPTRSDQRGRLCFTFYWPEAGRWENRDFSIELA